MWPESAFRSLLTVHRGTTEPVASAWVASGVFASASSTVAASIRERFSALTGGRFVCLPARFRFLGAGRGLASADGAVRRDTSHRSRPARAASACGGEPDRGGGSVSYLKRG